jgi:RHS repeat-associated protein
VANAAGQTVWRWDQQEPFGNNPADENPSGLGVFDLPLRFAGQTYDVETGLHYNYFRDFDPSLGIYKQSDPIGLKGGSNTYSYAFRNPLRFIDPKGLRVTLQTRPITNAQGQNMNWLYYMGGAHTWLELDPDRPAQVQCLLKPYGINPPFPITLSAFPSNGLLTRAAGRPGQWEGPPKKSINLTPTVGNGWSCDCGDIDPDSQFIASLILRFNAYGNDLPYAADPTQGSTFNSNGFTNGLLGAAGYTGAIPSVIGDNSPVPPSAFGPK